MSVRLLDGMGRAPRQLEFSGVFASTVTTPRKGTHEIDFCATLDLIDLLTTAGLQGAALLAAAGEFLHYSFGDRQRLVYLANKRTRIPLLVGVSHSTFDGCLELATEATAAGADALLVMVPYFYPYSQEEIANFFLEFAKEIGNTLPILIDHQPAFTSAIALTTMQRLLESGRFAGVIDGGGDWDYFEQLLAWRKAHTFALVCGADFIATRALCEGADALLSPAACVVPELLLGLQRAALRRDAAIVERLDGALHEFLNRTGPLPFPTGMKVKPGDSAVPLSPQTRQTRHEFDQWFPSWYAKVKEIAKHA